MALAAYPTVIQTSPDGATFTSCPGLTTAGLQPKNLLLDKTALGGGGGMAALQGLVAWQATLGGDYYDGHVAQANFLKREGQRCDVKAFYNDATALLMRGIVEGYEFDVNVAGKVSFTATIKGTDTAPSSINSGAPAPTDTPINDTRAGYSGVIKIGGTPVATTGEAFTLVSGKTYRINDATKRVWDPSVAPVIKDNAVTVAATNYTVDRLFGTVTFVASYTPTTPITADLTYIPLLAVAETKQFKFAVKNKLLDKTSFDSLGVQSWLAGLKEATGTFMSLTPLTADLDSGGGTTRLIDKVINRSDVVLEFNLGVGNLFRVWNVFESEDLKLTPAGIVENTINFKSTAKADSVEANFGWGT